MSESSFLLHRRRICDVVLCVRVFSCSGPTSHVKVGGGGVAHALRVGGHALVLPLVGLLAVLDLQRSCGDKEADPQCSF